MNVVARRVRVLEALRDLGIWLVDASVAALYHPTGIRLFSARMCEEIVRTSYEAFVWPTVRDDKPEQVWVIGKGVGKALSGCDGIDSERIISQPQSRQKEAYLAGLGACSAL